MTSAINGSIPATNSALVSAPVRTNFATAQVEITALQNQLGATGPYLAIGVTLPSPNPVAGTVAANQISVNSDPSQSTIWPDSSAPIGLNMYQDATGRRYMANGPAGEISMYTADPSGSPMSRMSFLVADINTAGPGALAEGHLGGILNLVYGPQGSPGGQDQGNRYVLIGTSSHLPGFVPPLFSLISGPIFPERVNLSLSTGVTAGEMAARVNFNSYFNTTTSVQTYLANGNAYQIAGRSTLGEMLDFLSAPAGSAGGTVGYTPLARMAGQDITAVGFTNLSVVTNRAGTGTLDQIQIGPAGSGPGGNGRALFIAN